jgi:hypothetical protein
VKKGRRRRETRARFEGKLGMMRRSHLREKGGDKIGRNRLGKKGNERNRMKRKGGGQDKIEEGMKEKN